MNDAPAVLLIGYGNPARGDDGLGPALARAIAALELDGVTVEWPYQLQVEDAATIAAFDLVIFADADAGPQGDEPFTCRRIEPEDYRSWTTHALAPGTVLALARDVFGATPTALLVGVRGRSFEAFHEGLSPEAGESLAATLAWLEPRLRDGGRELAGLHAAASTQG